MESDFSVGFGLPEQLSPRFFSAEKSLSEQRPWWDIFCKPGKYFYKKLLTISTIIGIMGGIKGKRIRS